MKDAILKLVADRQYVTFAELTHSIDGFKGDIAMTTGHDPNIFAWHALSQVAFDSLQELLTEGSIYIHPASRMTYMIDGLYPDMPEASRPPAKGYKKPHWVPMSFCDHPYDPAAA